ncbi:SDR family oxidoreductase [Streptomyces sp. BB1-1-1]|uniref:SDR family oxidoreductase n=1 Tax=Streptomyces sp. BB1-1-1 TaxID=3074430 RepID=UPI002877C431|nr:SDR family oxidoreductase [Streptomyces sp. BB1-1-1]WND33683.1 SDR family oxidoreductase [Streptomyces sp. BB1-1-1]
MSGPARQVVVVTGASSGIGRGAALAFAARGVSVVLAARSEQALAEVARECEERGGRALAVPTDVSDEAAVQALAQRAADWSGRIDIWVNAAAVWSYGRFEDTPGPVFRQIVETTLLGQVYAARAVLPHFRAEGHGVLINISSLYGRLSSPYVAPYVTAKWGLLGFSEVLRQELRDTPGIAVCTILPGAVDTPIYRHAANYTGRQIRPLPPVTSPERVVAAVLRAADHPQRQIVVGQTHRIGAWVHRFIPALYDRLIGPVVDVCALRSVPAPPHDGTVFDPASPTHTVDDGWRRHDHRLVAKALTLAVGAAALTTATRAVNRRRGQSATSSAASVATHTRAVRRKGNAANR